MKYVRVDLVGFVIWNVNIKLTLVITSLNQYILKMSIIQTIIGLSIACNVRRVLPLRWLICLLDVFAWYRYRWIIKKQQITITAKTAVIDRYLVSVSSSSNIKTILSAGKPQPATLRKFNYPSINNESGCFIIVISYS